MKVIEIIKYIENWAPKEIAWNKDNPGLQVGKTNEEVKNIFLCLELTYEAAEEAVKRKCNLIITHHPFIFRPLSKLDFFNDANARIIEYLIKNNITLYSAHTNLDFTKNGVSFKLAEKLQLKNINFVQNQVSNQIKLVVFVPDYAVDSVAESIYAAGGGIIGNYKECSYRLKGTGTFRATENCNPVIGEKGKFEKVDETRLEIIVNKWNLNEVLNNLIKSHPYEEPAYDVIPLENINLNYGLGTIGVLEEELDAEEFLKYIKEKLNLNNFRYSKGKQTKIKKVAVCGGAGIELLPYVYKNKADAFITADVKYHDFQGALNNVWLIDAGHYETEIVVMDEVQKRLTEFISNKKINVVKYSGLTNPINYFK